MDKLKEEKLKLNEAVGRYIVKKNELNKKIKALEKQIEDLNTKNTEFNEENSCIYNNHEERITDMLENAWESIYIQHAQQKRI